MAGRLVPVLLWLFVVKLLLHFMGWECLTLSPLFTSLIAANTFLIGFLITGIMSDYKEGERIPGELATSLSAIADEANWREAPLRILREPDRPFGLTQNGPSFAEAQFPVRFRLF